ncbi:hypothetical protein [Sphingomonas faeni]|uniref:hypothetical protein n=1 Tax=Sphingomonas faeni TaxID=185950 RepID=UPI00335D26C9
MAIAALVVLAPTAWPSPATAVPKGRANASDVGRDLLGGAALGGASGLLLTARHDDRVRLVRWAGPGGGGIDVAVRC